MNTIKPTELLCNRCAQLGKTCCQTSEVYITLEDAKRIESLTGSKDFFEYSAPINPLYAMNDDDPIWENYVFKPDGTRRVIKRNANGDCFFLSNTGCKLAIDVRPLVCRIYPYEYNAGGLYQEFSHNACPIHLLKSNETFEQMLQCFTKSKALEWHNLLYDEILLEKTIS
ncbi:MAG: YkgJ family cysteine cluster protein [Desulfobacterales bacterium]|nr:YkgJ family cysteine cluster protein [Desulfobacterales bacterium]